MTYRLPPTGRAVNEIELSDLVCKESQISYNQTIDSPSLTAYAGDTLILFYQENGHVTKIDGDPGHLNSGTISVFGSSYSSAADTLQNITDTIHPMEGVTLLRESSFDDGLCYQDNGSPKANMRKMIKHNRPRLEVQGPDIWCAIEVELPVELNPAEIYTLYWIWNFDGIGFVERYTTCIDVIII
jgi:hypothetical protein